MKEILTNNQIYNLKPDNIELIKNSPTLEKQYKEFLKLEEGVSLVDAKQLGDQVHFQNAPDTSIQRWFSYREGYSVELVSTFIKQLNVRGTVLDPFSGSGTTLLASRQNNNPSIGIDVNPISVMIAKAANEQYSQQDIDDLELFTQNLRSLQRNSLYFKTDFDLAEKVFNEEILQSLLQIREYIKGIDNKKISTLCFVIWLSIIEGVSNIKKEGNGIKYKNRKRTPNGYISIEKNKWEEENFPQNKFQFVKNKIIEKLSIVNYDLKNNYGLCAEKPKIIHNNCLELDQLIDKEVELTFFSPPYCNCFDYFEIHKVELWLGEFVKSKEELRKLRANGFRSNTNSLKDKSISYKNESLENLIELFDRDKLWSNKIPDVVRGYFDDMHTLLVKLYSKTADKGYVSIVVGNSAYTGVIIPTDIIIARIAEEVGFKIEKLYVTRHLTTSSQQKEKLAELKGYLRESVVLLRKE